MRLVAFVLAAVLAPFAFAQSVAGGFETPVQQVLNPLTTGRAMAFAPDGRLFYTENSTGQIMVVTTPTTTPGVPTVFASVSGFVPPTGGNDLGLHGICLHPGFPLAPGDSTNRYIYVCHATGATGAPQLVVKRFLENIAAPGTAAPLSETQIGAAVVMGGAASNFGGRIAFGPDGMLYIAVGDGGSAVALAGGFAQDTADSRGKVLRLQADGSIPLSNPITSNAYYARGLRNPRGIAFNTTTGDGFVVDSGNPTSSGVDEVNVLSAAANFGWDTNGISGPQGNAGYVNPAWVLAHTFEPSGVAFYPSSATAFPAIGYRGGVVYVGSEAASGAIHRVVLTGSNERTGVAAWPLASGFASPVRDLQFGPDGHLYAMTDGVLYRIRYIGNTSPNSPVANAGVDQIADEGALVTLNGTNSFDGDVSDVLRFTWRQVGGGLLVTIANATTASPTFTAPAVTFTQNYTFELIVEDGNGGVSNDFVIVTINDTGGNDGPPKKLLEAPGEGGCSTGGGPTWLLLLISVLPALLLAIRWRRRA